MADVKFEEVGPDEVLIKAKGFWDKYSKTILIAGAAVILLVGGYLGNKYFIQLPAEEKAQDAIFSAEEHFRNDSMSLALNGDARSDGFLKVIKKYGGERVIPGNILCRQRGTKWHPGKNVGMGTDHTIFALIEGTVEFKSKGNGRTYISVAPATAEAAE